jgi:serine phosphatase RsbU (regulator of sigma subunit)
MRQARLEIADAAGTRTVPVVGELTTVGRKAESDIKLSGTDVSREHAEIVRQGDRYLIRDKGSRFGTSVNGTPITEHELRPNDVIKVGQSGGCQMIFRVDEPASMSGVRTATSVAGDFRQVATLLESLRAMGSGRVLDEVLAMVIDSAIAVSGAERGFIMLAGADRRLEFKVGRAKGGITLPGRTFETSRKIPEEVFETGEARIVADLMDGDLAAAHLGTVALGIRHVMCLPLVLVRYVEQAEASDEQKRIGVLYLDSRERGALQASATRTTLEALATEAAVAIENARLYREATEKAKLEHELKIAAAIQQGLMPEPERQAAFFAAAGTTVPCRAIGGDFFEYVDLGPETVGFALGDVSGKGAPAALLTAIIQGMFTVQAESSSGPSQVLGTINRGLLRRAVESKFVTLFYATLAADGRLCYSNGGHNAPFLVRKDRVERLETGGMILGMFDFASYEEATLALGDGDTVVVFSDGVSEAQNVAGDELGDERIRVFLEANRSASAAQLRDGLTALVRDFAAGAAQGDDITVLVVRHSQKS